MTSMILLRHDEGTMDILNDVFTRPVIAHTHLPGVLHFLSMKGREGLSQLFSYEVELVAKTYMLDCRDALGKSMTLQVATKSLNGWAVIRRPWMVNITQWCVMKSCVLSAISSVARPIFVP